MLVKILLLIALLQLVVSSPLSHEKVKDTTTVEHTTHAAADHEHIKHHEKHTSVEENGHTKHTHETHGDHKVTDDEHTTDHSEDTTHTHNKHHAGHSSEDETTHTTHVHGFHLTNAEPQPPKGHKHDQHHVVHTEQQEGTHGTHSHKKHHKKHNHDNKHGEKSHHKHGHGGETNMEVEHTHVEHHKEHTSEQENSHKDHTHKKHHKRIIVSHKHDTHHKSHTADQETEHKTHAHTSHHKGHKHNKQTMTNGEKKKKHVVHNHSKKYFHGLHKEHNKKHSEKKEFRKCIKRRITNSESPEDCLHHHQMNIAEYMIPDITRYQKFKCCLGDMTKCLSEATNPCDCITNTFKCNFNNDNPTEEEKGMWLKTMPRAVRQIVLEHEQCLNTNTCSDKSKCPTGIVEIEEKFELLILQMCTYELAHCHDGETSCMTAWNECIKPNTCTNPLKNIQIKGCEKTTRSDTLRCIMEKQNPKLPTKHCREMICYHKFEEMSKETLVPTFETWWTKCMTVKLM